MSPISSQCPELCEILEIERTRVHKGNPQFHITTSFNVIAEQALLSTLVMCFLSIFFQLLLKSS